MFSSFFDTSGNGFDMSDVGIIVAAVIPVWLAIWGLGKWIGRLLDHRMAAIATRVDDRTAPVQPGANGGLSLPDAARQARAAQEAARAAQEASDSVVDRMERVENRLDSLLDLVTALVKTQGGHSYGSSRTRVSDLEEGTHA